MQYAAKSDVAGRISTKMTSVLTGQAHLAEALSMSRSSARVIPRMLVATGLTGVAEASVGAVDMSKKNQQDKQQGEELLLQGSLLGFSSLISLSHTNYW